MPDYKKFRDLVSHRIELEYDTGAKIVGYVAACKPPTGPVQVILISRAEILDNNGRVIETHDSLAVVPNLLTSFRLAEGPSASQ